MLSKITTAQFQSNMFSWSPECFPTHRVTWYNNQSTQVHFEIFQRNEWRQVNVINLKEIPTGVKELQTVLSDCYQDFVC